MQAMNPSTTRPRRLLRGSTRGFGTCAGEEFVIVGGSGIVAEARSGERYRGAGGVVGPIAFGNA